MTPKQQAREAVVTAALNLVATRNYLDYQGADPGPYDDAQREMNDDHLDLALEGWFNAYFKELTNVHPD